MQAELPHVAFFAPISPTLCFLRQWPEGNWARLHTIAKGNDIWPNNLVDAEGVSAGDRSEVIVNDRRSCLSLSGHVRSPDLQLIFLTNPLSSNR